MNDFEKLSSDEQHELIEAANEAIARLFSPLNPADPDESISPEIGGFILPPHTLPPSYCEGEGEKWFKYPGRPKDGLPPNPNLPPP